MKVRYLVPMGGVGFAYSPNEKDDNGNFVYYEVDEEEGARLIEAGFAEEEAKKTKAKKGE